MWGTDDRTEGSRAYHEQLGSVQVGCIMIMSPRDTLSTWRSGILDCGNAGGLADGNEGIRGALEYKSVKSAH